MFTWFDRVSEITKKSHFFTITNSVLVSEALFHFSIGVFYMHTFYEEGS